jgi:ABC-type branched-subunit amino acid transport system ATPase component
LLRRIHALDDARRSRLGLVKRYGQAVALGGIDLAVAAGSVFGLLGPDGAGRPGLGY